MSRPTLLRCAALALALAGTAFVVAWANTGATPSADATSTAASLPLVSFTLFAWPLVQGVLSP